MRVEIKKSDFERIKSGLKNTHILFDGLYSASIGYFDKLLSTHDIKVDSIHMYHDPNFGGGMPEPFFKAVFPGQAAQQRDGEQQQGREGVRAGEEEGAGAGEVKGEQPGQAAAEGGQVFHPEDDPADQEGHDRIGVFDDLGYEAQFELVERILEFFKRLAQEQVLHRQKQPVVQAPGYERKCGSMPETCAEPDQEHVDLGTDLPLPVAA